MVQSLIFLNTKFQASNFVSVHVQPGLFWTWSETNIVGFLMLIFFSYLKEIMKKQVEIMM